MAAPKKLKADANFLWFIEHGEIDSKYPNQYVAIVDRKIVAHGKNLKIVMAKAKLVGKPLIHKTLDPKTAYAL